MLKKMMWFAVIVLLAGGIWGIRHDGGALAYLEIVLAATLVFGDYAIKVARARLGIR